MGYYHYECPDSFFITLDLSQLKTVNIIYVNAIFNVGEFGRILRGSICFNKEMIVGK